MWSPSESDIITAEQRDAEASSAALTTLRKERDDRIAATQWVGFRALTTGQPIPQEWLDYWQALRDLPANTEDPFNPEWPVAPS